jgi:hypothetical protein
MTRKNAVYLRIFQQGEDSMKIRMVAITATLVMLWGCSGHHVGASDGKDSIGQSPSAAATTAKPVVDVARTEI